MRPALSSTHVGSVITQSVLGRGIGITGSDLSLAP
jgi:hypothetical protein